MPRKKILVIGSSNTDMTVRSSMLPRPGETVLGGDFRMGQGGKGANQAVAAKLLGGDVTFICKLGNDIFGDNALKHYSNTGLDVSHILHSDKPSVVALITVDKDAENCIVVASGANSDITEDDIQEIAPLIKDAGIVLLQLEIPLPAVIKAAELAHSAGVTVVLNPAPALSLPGELVRCVSLIIPNQCETTAITGIPVNDEESASIAANVLKSKGIQDVVITMGSKGSLVCDGKTTFVPARKVSAVDTTAAGDVFCGGLCVALAEGRTLTEAVRFATVASSLSVQRHGAQDSIPTREEVDKLIG